MAKAKKKELTKKIETGLSGAAGEYFVAGELSRRGYLATITQRNTRGVDILVSNAAASKSATIQVKTNQGYQKYWLLTSKAEDFHAPRHFYVMVNLGTTSGLPEYHIVHSKIVAESVMASHATWLNTPGKKGQVRKDSSIRVFDIPDSTYLDRWDLLGLD